MTFEQWYDNHLINNGTTFKSVLEGAYQAGWDDGDRQMVGCLTDKWQLIRDAIVGDTVIAYRDDCRQIRIIEVEACKDHMMYAYSHWMPLPDKPK
jgi:hypothetical protein